MTTTIMRKKIKYYARLIILSMCVFGMSGSFTLKHLEKKVTKLCLDEFRYGRYSLMYFIIQNPVDHDRIYRLIKHTIEWAENYRDIKEKGILGI